MASPKGVTANITFFRRDGALLVGAIFIAALAWLTVPGIALFR
jgi:hypothetical protein